MATPRGMEELARRGLYYCDHCHKRIPRSSFYRHRNQYYNHVTGEWNEADASNNTCMEVDTVDDELFQITETRNG